MAQVIRMDRNATSERRLRTAVALGEGEAAAHRYTHGHLEPKVTIVKVQGHDENLMRKPGMRKTDLHYGSSTARSNAAGVGEQNVLKASHTNLWDTVRSMVAQEEACLA